MSFMNKQTQFDCIGWRHYVLLIAFTSLSKAIRTRILEFSGNWTQYQKPEAHYNKLTLEILKTSSIAYSLGSIINAEVVKTNTSFLGLLGFSTAQGEIVFRITLVADNLTGFFSLVLFYWIQACCMNSYGWDRLWVFSLISSLL